MLRELTLELAKIAKEELNEEPKRIQEDLQHLKDWLAKQPHLKARTDDRWLVGILRGCKFSLEKVKQKLDLYYTLRTTAPDITLRIKPTDPKFIEFLKLGTCIVLPKSDTLFPRVILIRAGLYDPNKNNVADIMCVLYYLVQILVVEDDISTVMGTKILVDYRGVTMSHFTQANPALLKKMIAVSQESMPLRLKGSHHTNVPSGIEMIFTLVKGLLNEKANRRLKIHKSYEELAEFIPKDVLPVEYGGTGGTVAEIIDFWANKIVEYKSWMQQEELLGTDESKRPGTLKNTIMTIRPLLDVLQKKAEKEINENPRRVASDISAFREWLTKQPHLQSVKPTDQWLIAFLRGCKFSLERSKAKFDMYYSLKSIVPDFFSERDPLDSRLQEIIKLGVFLPLKKCEAEDTVRTCIVRIGTFNPSKYNLSDVIKVAFMITEILMLEDDNFNVCGEQVIVDMKGVGVNVLSQWTPALAKKVILCFEKALPVRLKGNHILNPPTGFDTAYTIFKTFLSEKLKKRIHVYNQDSVALYKAIPKSILPGEYGGEDASVQELIDHWKAKVESYRYWFLQEESAHSDESKRPGNPKTSSELFGVEGSFRKLEVD